MEGKNDGQRIVIVAGPKGFDVGSVLLGEGVHVGDDDVLVAIERPGDLEVEVLGPNPE